jgi:hypothetical protein
LSAGGGWRAKIDDIYDIIRGCRPSGVAKLSAAISPKALLAD